MKTVTDLTAIELMSRAISAGVNTTLGELFDIFKFNNITHLVITEDGHLRGIVSKEDLLQKMFYMSKHTSGKSYNAILMNNVKSEEIMTDKVVSVDEETEINEIVKIFRENDFHALPVIDSHRKPIGIITPLDLLKSIVT